MIEPAHNSVHRAAERHHHHTHAHDTRHGGDHHLLQVEDLTVSFRRYETEEATEVELTVGLGERVEGAVRETACADGSSEAMGRKRQLPLSRSFRRLRRPRCLRQRETAVLRGVNLAVHEGEVLAVVGASGAGKTLLADAVLGMFDPHATVQGRIWFDGVEQTAESLRKLRGERIALVPQSVASLDPLMKVGAQVRGGVQGRSERGRARGARQRELFERYDLGEEVAEMYPYQLSGGMARRVLLCCALMDEPQLIIADEPTVGLDLDLAVAALADLRSFADEGGGVMLITHDIELALRVADRVAVFHDGTVVEETAVASFASPALLEHPFSRALWHALPEHGFSAADEGAGRGEAGC